MSKNTKISMYFSNSSLTEQHCKLHLLNDDADEVLQESNKFEYNGERYIVPPLGVLAGPQLKLKPYPPGSKTKHKPITLDLRDRKVRDRLIGVDKTFNRVKGKELDDNGSNSDSDGYTPFGVGEEEGDD